MLAITPTGDRLQNLDTQNTPLALELNFRFFYFYTLHIIKD